MQQKGGSSGIWSYTLEKVTWNVRFTIKNNNKYNNDNNNSN